MKYLCLFFQLSFVLATIFLPSGESYLIQCGKVHKKYLTSTLIAQALCIASNVVSLFLQPKIMIWIVALQIILAGVIKGLFSFKAKRIVLNELESRIESNGITHLDPRDIRKFLIKEYEEVYFIEDIEKCLSRISGRSLKAKNEE